MEIYVLDRNINILGVFSTYNAILWNARFHEPGIFKAEFVYSQKMDKILKLGNLLYKTDEDEAGIITMKVQTLNSIGEELIQIRGYMASRYLNQRIIWSKMVISGTIEQVMRKMVYEHVIAPKNPARIMPNIELGSLQGHGEKIEKQITYDNLQEALTDLSKESELGYRLKLDIGERKFFFEVYKGTDRTSGSDIPCVFTRDYGNIYAQEYSEDITNYRNTCLVGGSGEDEDRILAVVGDDNTGLDRYEMFYNASILNNKDITDAEYISQLQQKGREKIAGYYIARTFESKVNQNKVSNSKLGDYVTCMDKKWGIMLNTQIKEIEKCFSKSERSLVMTFGDNVPTLVQLIRAKA